MRNLVLTLFFIFFFSCSDKPGNTSVLKPDEMEEVIWDLMRVDELVNENYRKDSGYNKFQESIILYKQVFQIHNITEEQFKTSFKYYQANPSSLKPLFDSLQTRGNNMTPVFKPATIE
jgi:hypothetical protein